MTGREGDTAAATTPVTATKPNVTDYTQVRGENDIHVHLEDMT